jgi:hypothetical protein
MKISPDLPQGSPADPASQAVTAVKTERVSTQSSVASTVERASTAAGAAVVPPMQRQTDVTFRRDSNGRIYYVVSDAGSGQEILEVPPKAVRDVGQGIEDYLKEQESKAGGSHVKVKA